MVANTLWETESIWMANLWKNIAQDLEKLNVWMQHVNVPKGRATKEEINNHQADWDAQIATINEDMDWEHKGELFVARWARETLGHPRWDATYHWARDGGVDLLKMSLYK